MSIANTTLDPQRCYAALQARDARFDGVFFVAVHSTKIYCRPICRVKIPKASNCVYFPHPSAAEAAGFRPCLRCRPELAPGQSSNEAVKTLAVQAATRIKNGALDELSVAELAAEFGVSERHLRRAISTEFGVSPSNLAQTYRLLLAKQLLSDSQLKVVDVAFAAGFSSLRRFNEAVKKQYRLTPSEIRNSHGTAKDGCHQPVLRFGFRPPLAWAELIQFLVGRSVPQCVQINGGRYYQTLRIGGHLGWFGADCETDKNRVRVIFSPTFLPVINEFSQIIRQLFDLDASPSVIDAHLKKDKLLRRHISQLPGLRVPGTGNGFELALRAVLGQQISVKAATTIFGRFVETFGETVITPLPLLNRISPPAAAIAGAPIQQLIDLGLTSRRAETVKQLALAASTGALCLDRNTSAEHTRGVLLSLPGIGPWTADYIAMRALGDPNALPHSDLALMKAVNAAKPQQMLAAANHWQPWRAYGAMRLWQQLSSGG